MMNSTYTIGKRLFEGTESISIVHVAHNYRYVKARVRIQCTVESGVTQSENGKCIRTYDSGMHGSTMTLHNMRRLKAFRHASGFSIRFHNDATQY